MAAKFEFELIFEREFFLFKLKKFPRKRSLRLGGLKLGFRLDQAQTVAAKSIC